jgi:acetyl-CoA acetyltransferase
MISDGGACLIVTASERASAFPKSPVRILGMAQTAALRGEQNDDQLLRPWIADVASRVYASAGVSRSEVDALYVQDPTSIWILQMLEWYGFCDLGEAGSYVQDGRIELGGELPVNTNGGQLSESYMWGWLHLVEAVRQLRGECGERQVEDANVLQYCSTMAFSKAASTILGSEAAA